MKISKIILCGNNGNNAIFLEYNVPADFSGVVNFAFGHGGFCDAWKSERGKLQTTQDGFNEKKYLDILKNSVILGFNTS